VLRAGADLLVVDVVRGDRPHAVLASWHLGAECVAQPPRPDTGGMLIPLHTPQSALACWIWSPTRLAVELSESFDSPHYTTCHMTTALRVETAGATPLVMVTLVCRSLDAWTRQADRGLTLAHAHGTLSVTPDGAVRGLPGRTP
jgi:hypothetical protein